MERPALENQFQADHARLLCDSFKRWTGRDLILPEEKISTAQALFEAPFVLVSHGTESDPVFNYANQTALALFEMSWDEFVRLPSRLSAEAMNREERAALLEQVGRQGYSANYSGVRISASGQRFRIENTWVWNLVDQTGGYCGQAAMFGRWQML